MAKIPRTNFHLSDDNELTHKLTDPAIPIKRACAYFFYKKENSYARLIQHSKYNNHPEIDRTLAHDYALEIADSGFFNDIDIILPVPMFWTKKLRRGFNQSEEIANAIGSVTGIPVGDNLTAIRGHRTQTRMNATERLTNARGIYSILHPEELNGKHILITDDVITTGATILACCKIIHDAVPTATISILSLASTTKNA